MEAVDFRPLVIVTLLAVVVPLLLHRFPSLRIPTVVGEILAGLAIGISGLGLIGGHHPWLEFLQLFGFAYLMFLSGLEIDFDMVVGTRWADAGASLGRRLVGTPLRAALLAFAVTVVMSLALSTWLVELGLVTAPIIMALILSTTSLGVVTPVLKERGLARTLLGQTALVSAVVADFSTVFLISALVVFQIHGPSFEVLLVLVLVAVTVLVYRVARLSQRHLPLEDAVRDLSQTTAQLDVRGSIALVVFFIALAQGLGIEIVLGAFLAGVIVSLLTGPEEVSVLRPKLNALGYAFFIPVFFIMVGANLDLTALQESPQGLLLVPVLVLMAFIVKLVAALVYRTVLPLRETVALGFLSSARLSLIIAIAAIGVEIGAITEATNAGIVLVAVVTTVVAPTLFGIVMGEAEPAAPRKRIVIVGAEWPQAQVLARRLTEHDIEVALVTAEPALEVPERDGQAVVLVPRDNIQSGLASSNTGDALAVVVAIDDPEQALRIARSARMDYAVEHVVAVLQSKQHTGRFADAGVDVIDPTLSAATVLESMLLHPHLFSLISGQSGERDVADVRLRNAALAGRRLAQLPMPGDALVVAVARDGDVIVPDGGTELRRGDVLTLFGSRDALASARNVLGTGGPQRT